MQREGWSDGDMQILRKKESLGGLITLETTIMEILKCTPHTDAGRTDFQVGCFRAARRLLLGTAV